MPARPWTVYACTKLFGEALARWYSDHHGMSMIAIRICWFQAPTSELLRIPGHDIQQKWVSPRDLTQLIVKSICSDVKFATFFGVSNNTGRFWDISNAQQLVGYEPQDDAANCLNSAISERY
jgi:uronate dehydrogenase